nr:hypothetical protein [Tanacetum cinerariifolium]
MWSKFRYKEIVDNGNGKGLFKFSNEIGMVTVANQSPWMVNKKPLMVQIQDPNIGMTKAVPTKIPIWVKLTGLPMEAWTTKGISAITSSIGDLGRLTEKKKGMKDYMIWKVLWNMLKMYVKKME